MSLGTESGLAVSRGQGKERQQAVARGYGGGSFGDNENALKLDSGVGCTMMWLY